MALYRFRVSFEDYDEVVREIDVKSNQTFEDLHRAIHQAIGYNCEYPSSFYISNDQWIKGEEITFMPNQRRIDRGVALMDKVKLSNRIDDPHQKFYYTFNFDRPFDFHIELLRIILDETPGTTYPAVVRSAGEPPKQFGNVFNPTVLPPVNEDFDFLNELEYSEEDAEEGFTEVADVDEVVDADEPIVRGIDDEEEEADEFGSEFSDNEGFEDEGPTPHHDEY
ncbi:MAG: IS1096 element passenger TnpR family protein [Mucilaginibacter sp.]